MYRIITKNEHAQTKELNDRRVEYTKTRSVCRKRINFTIRNIRSRRTVRMARTRRRLVEAETSFALLKMASAMVSTTARPTINASRTFQAHWSPFIKLTPSAKSRMDSSKQKAI